MGISQISGGGGRGKQGFFFFSGEFPFSVRINSEWINKYIFK